MSLRVVDTEERSQVFMVITSLFASVGAAIVLMLVSPAVTAADPETAVYSLDRTEGVVDFTITASKIFQVKRKGEFTDFTGQLSYNAEDPDSTHVDLTVYTSSIDIHNAEHNQLLKSGAFFDVEHFPTMHFMSSSASMKPDGTLSVTGDMTIRGITQQMTIPVKLKGASPEDRPTGAVFESTFEIDRTKFGLIGIPKPQGFNVSISKTVRIHIAIAAGHPGES